jgi:hypothetical protein
MRALLLTVTDIGWRLPSLDAGLGNGTYSTNVPNCAEQVLYFDFNEIAEVGVSSAGSRRGDFLLGIAAWRKNFMLRIKRRQVLQ